MKAHEFTSDIERTLNNQYDNVTMVRDVIDEDSPVEHEVDMDISHDGTDYSVKVIVTRIGSNNSTIHVT